MEKQYEQLQLKFDPRTIEHLGIKMYSRLPYALAELVANAYDADATNVNIDLYDTDPNDKKIIISDNGDGMSYEEIRDNFLVIGRKRRDTDENRTTAKGRKITGKKGLGKLALFGIGKIIRVETSKVDDIEKTVFVLDWDKIINESSGTYYPSEEKTKKMNVNDKGTKIILTNLSRTTDFNLNSLAISLSKLFNCFDSNFKVCISKNNSESIVVTREMKYESIDKEFQWNVNDIISEIKDDYDYKSQLKGTIISSKKPMKQDLRGITIYANGRLVNLPSFFGVSEAGHVFSYITGWIDADFLDECDQDLISTDRQSISWDLPDAEKLHNYLQKIIKFLVKDWSVKRKATKKNNQTKKTGIDIESWYKNVPDTIRPKLEKIINKIENKPEMDDVDFSDVVSDIHELIPPYTFYHYRLLHDQIKQVTEQYYKEKNYYTAFQEAIKRYKNIVKEKSGSCQINDKNIVEEAFGKNGKLSTTAKFQRRPNGQPFSAQTLKNIEEGQQFLSIGVVLGGRNVLSHEEIKDLSISKLFTEKDCLDLLSLISHLFKRLDESVKKQ